MTSKKYLQFQGAGGRLRERVSFTYERWLMVLTANPSPDSNHGEVKRYSQQGGRKREETMLAETDGPDVVEALSESEQEAMGLPEISSGSRERPSSTEQVAQALSGERKHCVLTVPSEFPTFTHIAVT